MLRSGKEILGYQIHALDGNIGHVDDFYFDDKRWMLRYLVVDTGGWLSGRKVLVSPLALKQPEWARQILPVSLTKEQIENSPSIDLEKPVSRQYEQHLYEHYGWTPYWTPMGQLASPRPMTIKLGPHARTTAGTADRDSNDGNGQNLTRQSESSVENPHLRSMDEVIGYSIQARDGGVGHVETFIIDDESWSIMYLVIDTRDWLPGKKVMLALEWVEAVHWFERLVRIDLAKETIKNSPEYDPDRPVNRQVEERLYDYHGRPVYW